MATNTVLNIIVNGENNASSTLDGVSSSLGRIGESAMRFGGKLSLGVTTPLAAMGLMAINSASDLEESLNKVGVVFGENAGEIEAWSATASTALGQSQQGALEAVGTFGNLFSAMGIGQDASANMSMGLVQLASDLASFNNIDPTEALEKLRAGLVGETEPLRTLGVNLSAASVEAYALGQGLAATKEELTPAILAQARYALILEQTTLAQGDYARTADGLANSQRSVSAQISDLTANLGTMLLPIATTIIGKVSELVTWFTNLDPKIQQTIVVIAGLAAAAGPVIMALGAVATAVGAIASPIGLIVVAIAALAAAWATDFGGIRTTVTEFWNAHLRPIFETLVQWLQTNIPIALETLSRFWDTVLKPAIETVWSFLQQYIFPVIETLVNVYIALTKAELQALALIWENVLKPAIEVVWAFLQQYVIPIIEELVSVYIANLKQAIDVLAKFWRETLKPAIDAVWKVIVEQLIPGLVDLKAKIEGVVRRALETAKRLFDDISGAVHAVKDAIQGVIDWFNRMKDAISNWSPPAWVSSLGGAIANIAGGLGHAAIGAEQFGTALSGLAPVAEDVQKLANALLAMVNALAAVGGYGTAAVGPNLQRLIDQFGAVIRKLERAAAEWSGPGLTAAVTLAEAMGKIGAGLKAAAAGLEEVAGYTEAKVGPALQRLIDQYGAVIRKLVRAAAEFDELGYQAAERLAAAMGAIGGKLKAAVEGLTAVSLYGASRIGPSIERFVMDMAFLVDRLAAAATKFEVDGLAAAERLAQAMGAIGRELGDAVAGLLAIATYGGARNFVGRMQQFVADLIELARALGQAVTALGDEVLKQIERAAAFAEPIGRLVGVVQAGMDAILALSGYARRIDITGAARRFARDLVELAEALAAALMDSSLMAARGLPGAVALAEHIGGLVGVVQPALTAIEAVLGYTSASNLAAAMRAFAADMMVAANALVAALGSPTDEMIAAYQRAQEFATAIGGVLGLIRPAMDLLNELSNWGGPSNIHTGMQNFLRHVEGIMNILGTAFQTLSPQTVQDAVTFSQAIADMVGNVRRAMEESELLAGFESVYDGALAVATGWMDGLMDGLRSRMDDLVGLMAYIRGLFPSSPAEYGPWRDLPQGELVSQAWLGGMTRALGQTSGLESTLGGLRDLFIGAPMAQAALAGGGYGGAARPATMNVTFTMQGPFYIREEADIKRLAEQVGDVLAGQADLRWRLGA